MLTLKPASNPNKSKNKSIQFKYIRLMQCHTHTILHGVYDQGTILRETFSRIAVTRGLGYPSFEEVWMKEIISSGELGNCGKVSLKTAEGIILESFFPLDRLDRVDFQDDQPGLSPNT
ncbi:hypothetical protein BPAE_0232g00040 [Botrytis paeoniae]|uniref:Uncharacterized protein n=1 Tax=Botrytis paeoniae TaxID=278948 RepID=A0A4Z1FEL6_9HELO|nr:hypothetical protein BPAE_0232g00040 [Botrytis paeoniae]